MAEFRGKFTVEAAEEGRRFEPPHAPIWNGSSQVVAKDNTGAIKERDWRFEKCLFRSPLAGCTVTIHEHLDGNVSIRCGPDVVGRFTAAGQKRTSKKAKLKGQGKDGMDRRNGNAVYPPTAPRKSGTAQESDRTVEWDFLAFSGCCSLNGTSRDSEWTRLLDWPGYRVFQQEIDEKAKTLKLWVRRKAGTKKRICSGCGKHVAEIHEVVEREVRDLPWCIYRATVVVEVCRPRCPDCGPRMEKVLQLPRTSPFGKRFEEAVGTGLLECVGRQVGLRFGIPASAVRTIDFRYLKRWEASRRKPP